ncbi:hypothetical protein SESBI_19251 [Sesbania bispinosa]|nr:hypothetical protein SESBI_19251 [Sesbania bispinosa]
MAVMEKLKMFVVQEPVVAASCLIAGFGFSAYWFTFPSAFGYWDSFLCDSWNGWLHSMCGKS